MSGVELHHGDCREVLARMPAESFTACVTDPPYALTADAANWRAKSGEDFRARPDLDAPASSARRARGGFMGKEWDAEIPGVETWREVYRVLKPGAFLLAFGGTRTFHRLACAIEDAGFEIRDCLSWLHGQGFPKSLDIGKAIDSAAGAVREDLGPRVYAEGHVQRSTALEPPIGTFARTQDARRASAPATPLAAAFQGYGTALKPAWEPILVAMKPCEGTFAANALEHGVAGLNIDRARVEAEGGSPAAARRAEEHTPSTHDRTTPERYAEARAGEALGRWPANLVLDQEAAELLDEQAGELTSGKVKAGTRRAPTGDDKVALGAFAGAPYLQDTYGDTGGASRFFYVAKPSAGERHAEGELHNTHPTVKPLELIRWLVRLVKMPTGTRILEPFAGSGTGPLACLREDVDCVAIERELEYLDLAHRRCVADAPLYNASRVKVFR